MCWKRLLFGLNVARDIFQVKIDQILEGLDSVVSITDGVAVYGRNNDDRGKNLPNFMTRAAETGLMFNSEKYFFFGNIYTPTGIKPDSVKEYDIKKMPIPQDKDELQCFQCMLH